MANSVLITLQTLLYPGILLQFIITSICLDNFLIHRICKILHNILYLCHITAPNHPHFGETRQELKSSRVHFTLTLCILSFQQSFYSSYVRGIDFVFNANYQVSDNNWLISLLSVDRVVWRIQAPRCECMAVYADPNVCIYQ